MSKARSIKIFYIIAALALLVGMLPIVTAAPVSAGSGVAFKIQNPLVAAPNDFTTDDYGYNVSGSRVMVTVNPTGVTWVNQDLSSGALSAWIAPANPPVNSAFAVITGGWGETSIVANFADNTSYSQDKKWGRISRTSITAPGSSYVTWNEGAKTFGGGVVITDTVYGAFLDASNPAVPYEHVAQGAILNWYLLQASAPVDMTPAEGGALKARMSALLTNYAARFAKFNASWSGAMPNTLINGVTTCQTFVGNSDGTSSVTILTTGEEALKVVVVPEYPGTFSAGNNPQLNITPEITTWYFKTREMEVVPQVRWAGEKIVLAKNFGTSFYSQSPTYIVKFSLENGNGGSLGPIGVPATPPTGNVNTSQTQWAYVASNGEASCILEDNDQGQVTVNASLYHTVEGALVMENQHIFVTYFLKFEDLYLGNVSGKRDGHNTGNWVPSNPYDIATDYTTTTDILNVSQDALLRARVRGWFTNSNPSSRDERIINAGGTVGLLLPKGRWILPDDWPNLAGGDANTWMQTRIHWDIMDSPADAIYATDPLGPYTKPAVAPATGRVNVSGNPLVGPFMPDNELMTDTGWNLTCARPDTNRPYYTVVQSGALDKWDAPMPPAKIIFQIMPSATSTDKAGFFKSALKTDIYYNWNTDPTPAKLYTNPFYQINIPAHEAIPAFANNGGYDWATFAQPTAYGKYNFWFAINQPDGLVATADQATKPTKVEVYSDNHGEAMTWLNGNWNLDLTKFMNNAAADIKPGATVGNTTIQAWADYPYMRVHQPIFSANVTKQWTWGGQVLGADVSTHAYPPDGTKVLTSNRMVLAAGMITIDGASPGNPTPNYPNDTAVSNKKIIFLWVTDRDGLQSGVLGAKVAWTIATTSGSVPKINTVSGRNIGSVTYNEVTAKIDLTDGFLTGTNGSLTGSLDGTQAVSFLMDPTLVVTGNPKIVGGTWNGLTWMEALFYKTYNVTKSASGLQPKNFAVAAIEVINAGGANAFNVLEQITSADFGLTPGAVGTVSYNTNASFATGDMVDDTPKYGDANNDSNVNMGDVTKIERIILGLANPVVLADANGDNTIDMGDVVKVERMILGLK